MINLENQISKFKFVLQQSNDKGAEIATELNKTADEIDRASDKFRAMCMTSALILPQKVYEIINSIIDKMYIHPAPSTDYKAIPSLSKYIEEHLNKLIGLSNQLNEQMRNDLNIDQLISSFIEG